MSAERRQEQTRGESRRLSLPAISRSSSKTPRSPTITTPRAPKSPNITATRAPRSPNITTPRAPRSPNITTPRSPKSPNIATRPSHLNLPNVPSSLPPKSLSKPDVAPRRKSCCSAKSPNKSELIVSKDINECEKKQNNQTGPSKSGYSYCSSTTLNLSSNNNLKADQLSNSKHSQIHATKNTKTVNEFDNLIDNEKTESHCSNHHVKKTSLNKLEFNKSAPDLTQEWSEPKLKGKFEENKHKLKLPITPGATIKNSDSMNSVPSIDLPTSSSSSSVIKSSQSSNSVPSIDLSLSNSSLASASSVNISETRESLLDYAWAARAASIALNLTSVKPTLPYFQSRRSLSPTVPPTHSAPQSPRLSYSRYSLPVSYYSTPPSPNQSNWNRSDNPATTPTQFIYAANSLNVSSPYVSNQSLSSNHSMPPSPSMPRALSPRRHSTSGLSLPSSPNLRQRPTHRTRSQRTPSPRPPLPPSSVNEVIPPNVRTRPRLTFTANIRSKMRSR